MSSMPQTSSVRSAAQRAADAGAVEGAYLRRNAAAARRRPASKSPKIRRRSRKLILPTTDPNLRVIIVRATDVPTYVEYGAADFGVAGKDVLLEHGGSGLYQPVDLDIARCRMSVAVAGGFRLCEARCAEGARLARRDQVRARPRASISPPKGVHVDLIKLYGSMELAPLVGPGGCDRRSGEFGQYVARQQSGGGGGNHADFIAPRGQPGGAEAQARGIAADSRRVRTRDQSRRCGGLTFASDQCDRGGRKRALETETDNPYVHQDSPTRFRGPRLRRRRCTRCSRSRRARTKQSSARSRRS